MMSLADKTDAEIARKAKVNVDKELKKWFALKINWGKTLNTVELKEGIGKPELHAIRRAIDRSKSSKIKVALLIGKALCPLKWWKVYHEQFPIIAQVAKRYLAKPSANGFQERVFSYTGMTARQKTRSCLSALSFEKRTILRANWEWTVAAMDKLALDTEAATVKALAEMAEKLAIAEVAKSKAKSKATVPLDLEVEV